MNRLGQETSPYLRQHADNPVDWYPWCAEALARARDEQRPILLSIGYSACHWCHVMAHESFEDPATAALMNRHFVNIKVDREERPDLDKIYQVSHQLLTQRGGGWPLTMFLDPQDLVAFFGGTYFPPTPRYGLPGFPELLERVAAYYHEQGDEIRAQNQRLREALASLNPRDQRSGELDATPLDLARHQLGRAFDEVHGGFGGAPKFPQPPNLERLLRHWAASGDQQALHMAGFTLEQMAAGGIHDHLGGGFYRYAVDERWLIPHFEKMLYDNAQLLALYAQAWAASGRQHFAAAAHDTVRWVLTEMQAPQGAFYAALDADSEGEEGRYYVWEREQIEALLDPEEYAAFASRYGLLDAANFEGRWHLHLPGGMVEESAATQRLLNSARDKL
ncbi:MAG: thioredoxin domain-containing protein, partial [Gammaproteobacteria bacterium]